MQANKPRVRAMPLNHTSPVKDDIEQKISLYRQVASSMMKESKFYENGINSYNDLLKSIKLVDDTEWVLKLATYARNELNLRTVPLVLTSEIALDSTRDKSFGSRKYINAVIKRPDEIPEILAYCKQRCAELKRDKLPQMILKGLTPCWGKFSTYSLTKYRAEGKGFTLRDAMFLTHPAAINEEQDDTLRDLADNMLTTIDDTATWEYYISKHGSTKESWSHIIPSMGYMALLRNINNFIKVGISKNDVQYVCQKLSDRDEVGKSKQLPFRFYTAYKNLLSEGDYRKYKTALEIALGHSTVNIPRMSGKTAVLIDTSGSMSSSISSKSTVSCVEIASLMGCMLYNHNRSDTIVITFDNTAKYPQIAGCSVLLDTEWIVEHSHGGATYLYKALQLLTDNDIFVNRIIVLSDMQTYGGNEQRYLEMYKSRINPVVKLFTIDLQGYKNNSSTLGKQGVYELAGYSDRVFNLINAYDEDPVAIVSYISTLII